MKSLQSHLMKKLFVLKSSGILNAVFLHNLIVIMLRFKFWSEIFFWATVHSKLNIQLAIIY